MQKYLDLSWTRFIAVMLFNCSILALIVVAEGPDKESWFTLSMLCLVFASILVFVTLGFVRLRQANAQEQIAVNDVGRILKHMIGPVVPAALWFLLTALVPIVATIAWALHTRAA
jgi:hypothetical protein